MNNKKRGYFGIGIYRPKCKDNMGTLWRSAYLFGADFIFTIGHRYKHQPTDTIKAVRHVPLFHYEDWESFKRIQPESASIIIVEQGGKPLKEFNHPKEAVYVLGAEDDGVPEEYQKGHSIIEIESNGISSLNVATAGTIILYDKFTN